MKNESGENSIATITKHTSFPERVQKEVSNKLRINLPTFPHFLRNQKHPIQNQQKQSLEKKQLKRNDQARRLKATAREKNRRAPLELEPSRTPLRAVMFQ